MKKHHYIGFSLIFFGVVFFMITYTPLFSNGAVGLIGHWPLDEGTGTQTADISGNGRNGTLVNNPIWDIGKIGNALNFNGVNGYVSIHDFNPPISISLEAWINPQTNNGLDSIILNKNNAEYDLRISPSGTTVGNLTGQVGNVTLKDTGFNFYDPQNVGQWYHVVYTFDDASNTHKLYRNGVEVASGINSASIANTSNALWIGRNSQYNFGTFKGKIDNVRIYDRALTATEVMTAFNESISTSSPTPSSSATPTPTPGPVTVGIDGNTTFQTMAGFGTSQRLFDDPHLFNNIDPNTGKALTTLTTAQQDEVLDKLYKELKLTRLRAGLAAGTGATGNDPPGIEPVNDNSDPNVTDLSKFNFGRVDNHCEYINRLKPRGVTTYFSSPAMREPWMGVTITNPINAAEYAEWLYSHVQRCRDLGVDFPYLSVSNEPSYIRNPMSGAFIRDVIKVLGPKLQANGFNIKFVVSDDLSSTKAQHTITAVLSDPIARSYVGALAFHLYDEPFSNVSKMKTLSQTYNLPLWMTEFSVGALPTAGLSATPFAWGNLMNDLIGTYSVSVIDYLSGYMGQGQGQEESGGALINLLHKTTGAQEYLGYSINKVYYIIGQYSRFVFSGDTRISTNSSNESVKVTAFKNGSTVSIVAINNSPTDQSVQFNLSNLSVTTLQNVRTSANENWAILPSINISSGSFNTNLPANSITTFTTRDVAIP